MSATTGESRMRQWSSLRGSSSGASIANLQQTTANVCRIKLSPSQANPLRQVYKIQLELSWTWGFLYPVAQSRTDLTQLQANTGARLPGRGLTKLPPHCIPVYCRCSDCSRQSRSPRQAFCLPWTPRQKPRFVRSSRFTPVHPSVADRLVGSSL